MLNRRLVDRFSLRNLLHITNGIVAACSNAAALNSAEDSMTGSAAALLGSLQYGSGILSSLLLALFSDGTPKAMVVIIFLAILASTLMAWIA